jgi:hypothetical protein
MDKRKKVVFAIVLGAIALAMYIGIIIKTAYY